MPVCPICFHHCNLSEGQTGFCKARACFNGKIVGLNYGRISSLALDPIEKKPLYHFYPHSAILSVGGFGCNLRCPFCQNHHISMSGMNEVPTQPMSPRELTELALNLAKQPRGNLGVAFTYNEPFISFEYVRDCCQLLHQVGLKTVLVTNGHINKGPLEELLPLVDAMNIDLKGFTQGYYTYLGGDFEQVKQTIETAYDRCHIEVTTLIVPTLNDSAAHMRAEAEWLASLSSKIPLHISRYFPHYKLTNIPPTPVETVLYLCDVARQYLRYVHAGNC
ncbi:MAG: AmmeMemoRadiSam system radical SAM enzyme [Alphaproteobacteria bacterium]|nr:AmmeMemoRadiSam system radical SAM enzyme [Alphaproteobacteria bacterium]